MTSENSRNAILSAIQGALTNSQPQLVEIPTGYNRKPRFDLTGTEAIILRFTEMLGKVGGEAHILNGEEASVSVLRGILGELRDQAILIPEDPVLDRMGLPRIIEESGSHVLHPTRTNLTAAAGAALGITTAIAGLADTGTVVLQHFGYYDRLAALLAPVHVVFLLKSKVYPDKVTFLHQARRLGLDLGSTPSTWVTGPSLTADIEKVLVRGAHGPHKVIVILY